MLAHFTYEQFLQRRKQLNRKKILYAIAAMIACSFALFFWIEKKEAKQVNPIEFEKNPIIEPIYEELTRKTTYLYEVEKLEATASSKEEWFIEYKKLQEEYSDVAEKHSTIYDNFSKKEIDLLFRVVQAEIGHHSFNQICNVASVIFNRVEDGRFGYSLSGVLNPSQFSTIGSGAIYKHNISERVKLACEYVYIFGDTTGGALFFHSNAKSDTFSGYPYRFSDGAHHFY